MNQEHTVFAYPATPSVPTIFVSRQGSVYRAFQYEHQIFEFSFDETSAVLTLLQGPDLDDNEWILLRVCEDIFGQDFERAFIDCSSVQSRLRSAASRKLLIQVNGQWQIDRCAFYQYPALWHRRPSQDFAPERWTISQDRRHPIRPDLDAGVMYQRFIPHIARTLSLETFDCERHLDIFHHWQNQPRISVFWEMPHSKEQLTEYIRRMEQDPHQRPLIACLDGQPIGYFEVYWAPENRLGPYYEYEPYDRGYHFLIGETNAMGKATPAIIQSMVHCLFLEEARTRRIMGEPRHDNLKLLRYLGKIPAWNKIKEFDFPHKRAALLECRRELFFAGGSL